MRSVLVGFVSPMGLSVFLVANGCDGQKQGVWEEDVHVVLVLGKTTYSLGEEPHAYLEFINSSRSVRTLVSLPRMVGLVQVRPESATDWPRLDIGEGNHGPEFVLLDREPLRLNPGTRMRLALGTDNNRQREAGWFNEVLKAGPVEISYILMDIEPEPPAIVWRSNTEKANYQKLPIFVPTGTSDSAVSLFKRLRREEPYRTVSALAGTHWDWADRSIVLTDFGKEIADQLDTVLPLLLANVENPLYQRAILGILEATDCRKALPWLGDTVKGVFPFAAERERFAVLAVSRLGGWYKDGVYLASRWYWESCRCDAIARIAASTRTSTGRREVDRNETFSEIEDCD